MKLDLKGELLEQLEIKDYCFVNIGGKEICWLDEATVVSWIIMAVIILLSFLLTRNLKAEGKLSKRQLLLEMGYTKLEDFFHGIVMDGVLPRKTFSMGHAQDKRYYIEARKIR